MSVFKTVLMGLLFATLAACSGLAANSNPSELSDVAGTKWTVVAVAPDGQNLVSTLPQSTLTLSFGSNGQVTGSAGCNSYFAAYTLQDGDLQIGPAGATKMLCRDPAGVMDQEQAFLMALDKAETIVADGNGLMLNSAGNLPAIQLAPAKQECESASDQAADC